MNFLEYLFQQFSSVFTKKPSALPTPTPEGSPTAGVDSFPFTPDQMRLLVLAAQAAPKVNAAMVGAVMRKSMIRFDLQTPNDVAHGLAHLSHESMGFSRTVESLVYSQKRILEVFGHKIGPQQAAVLAGDEYALAEAVYGMRADLGNIYVGDGFAFRGHFFVQLTGRSNTKKCADYFGIPVEELLKRVDDLEYNCDVSCWYLSVFRKGFKDGAAVDSLVRTTAAVNGGQNGFSDRESKLNSIKRVMETF